MDCNTNQSVFDNRDYRMCDYLVSVNDYDAFVQATGYVCQLDREHDLGWLKRDIRLNYGQGLDVPMLRLTLADAAEYAKWRGGKIPSESELRMYYLDAIKRRTSFKWTTFCWTTSSEEQQIVILNGPYCINAESVYEKRLLVSPTYTDDFDVVAVRLMVPRE